MKPIHIVAGLLALVAGAVALYAAKGSPLHRKSGLVFAAAMLVMASTGALMAIFAKPNRANVMAGAVTFYLVSTGLLAVKRSVAEARGLTTGFMIAALALGAFALQLAFQALGSADGRVGGIPPQPLFLFATVALIGGAGDAHVLLAGRIEGARRLARHLWRMTFAMWIATTSFFLGQPKVFPDWLRERMGLRAIPVLIVTALLFYWLVRVRRQGRRSARVRATAETMP